MRGYLKYGVPLAGGLATAGYAASQGEDPGSAVLAGLAGGAGAAGGLLGARMAGKYAPALGEMAQSAISPVGRAVRSAAEQLPEGSKRRAAMVGTRNKLADLYRSAGNIPASAVQATTAAAAVPLAAGLAGLGGVAAGAIPGAMGVPGFQSTTGGAVESSSLPSVPPGAYGALIGGTAGTVLGGIPGGLIGGTTGALIGSQYNQNVITDPELVGSSNTQMARMSTPTLRYIG
jgi:hypothetical protein